MVKLFLECGADLLLEDDDHHTILDYDTDFKDELITLAKDLGLAVLSK